MEMEMIVRLFVEIDLDDKTLMEGLGSRIPGPVWENSLSSGLGRQVETFVGTLTAVREVKAVFIPRLLSSL
jgi:hypothetical protein